MSIFQVDIKYKINLLLRKLTTGLSDLMDNAEIKYNKLNDKLNIKGNSKVEDLTPALKAEIEELKSAATATK